MIENKSIFIATPCYGGLVTQAYMQSIIATVQYAAGRSLVMTLALLGNDALITRARNTLVSSFLNDTQSTHLLFIDADISFEPEQVIRLLEADKDIAAAMYPIKALDWEIASLRPDHSAETIEESALNYVGMPLYDSAAERDGDFISASYAGTGMMLIRRETIEAMIKAYPKLQYDVIHSFPRVKRTPKTQYALFECMIDPETGLYLSEDFAFCHRWRALGGKIWLDTESRLTHWGAYGFAGNTSPRYQAVEAMRTVDSQPS